MGTNDRGAPCRPGTNLGGVDVEATPSPAAVPRSPTGESGLTSADAAERLRRDGPNCLVPEGRRHRIKRLVGPLADPMVALLLVAAPTYLAMGEVADAVIALAALVPIAAVGWLLEARAERTLEQLRRMTQPTTVAWRDGEPVRVPSENLVVGDLIWLHEGDAAPADALVVDATQLLVDESALTGEALPVAKGPQGDDEVRAIWAGTKVLSGSAIARVVTVGVTTRWGRIGSLLASMQPPATPLQRAMGGLVRGLGVVAAVSSTAVVLAELLHGDGWGDGLIAGISLAIAAIPEEFPMIYTLYLALGAWRLAQQHALVRRLPSVETLGSATVICADKTGTLTQGTLSVAHLWTPGGSTRSAAAVSEAEHRLLVAALAASEPELFDPLDAAIASHARERGLDPAGIHCGRLVTDWPFDVNDKYLTHLWTLPDGSATTAAKGSIEGILAHARAEPSDRQAARTAHDAFASEGMRVIGAALSNGGAPTGDRSLDEADLAFVGLVAFSDPVRDGVADALAECREAGIRVIMITGDHPATAHAVAEGLDLPHERDGADVIATGADLDEAGDDDRARLVETANVFARTRPEQKHLIVEGLRRAGEIVAMTGDGINDAPALREADIGVAMGVRGTEVAREAATLVLLDDNFATIVTAIRNGRRIFDNLTRAFAYLVSFHPPLLLAAMVIPFLDRPLLLLPVHLVLLELLLHPIVSLVFQADPPDADVMRRPPSRPGEALRLRALWRPYAIGLTLAAGIITEYLVVLDRGWPTNQARAFGFTTLLVALPVLLLSSRSPDRPFWSSGRPITPTVVGAMGAISMTIVASLYAGPVADLLQFAPFPPASWPVLTAVAVVTTAWSEPLKRR